jgi:hypothetical protein
MLGPHGTIVIKGHDSAPVDIDGHKSDAVNIDKDFSGVFGSVVMVVF